MTATLNVEPPKSRATTEPLSDPSGRVWVYDGRKVSSDELKASRKDWSSISDVERREVGLEMLRTDKESITFESHWFMEYIVLLDAKFQLEEFIRKSGAYRRDEKRSIGHQAQSE